MIFFPENTQDMVLLLDGNTEIGEQGKKQPLLFDVIFFPPKISIIFHATATCDELPSYKSTTLQKYKTWYLY